MEVRPIYRIDPDGDLDYDGDEELEDREEAYRIDWENSSYSW